MQHEDMPYHTSMHALVMCSNSYTLIVNLSVPFGCWHNDYSSISTRSLAPFYQDRSDALSAFVQGGEPESRKGSVPQYEVVTYQLSRPSSVRQGFEVVLTLDCLVISPLLMQFLGNCFYYSGALVYSCTYICPKLVRRGFLYRYS